VTEWLLFNTNSAIFQLYDGENKLIFNEIMMSLFKLFIVSTQIKRNVIAKDLIVYPCFNWYCVRKLKNCKWNSSIEWIQFPLFTGKFYCWTFNHFIVWLGERSQSWEIPIKIFLSETICSIRTKCWWNSHWMVLFQKCVRRFGPSTKMAPTAELSLT
jgi:hypothetical protein